VVGGWVDHFQLKFFRPSYCRLSARCTDISAVDGSSTLVSGIVNCACSATTEYII
jgi:hypothetical protein